MIIAESTRYQDDLSSFFLFFLIAAALNLFTIRKQFFTLSQTQQNFAKVTFLDLLICFIAYFSIAMAISPLILNSYIGLLGVVIKNKPWLHITLLQLQNIVLTLAFLGLYSTRKKSLNALWKDPHLKSKTSYISDVICGLLMCLIAFPTVLAINQFCEMINTYLFHQVEIDQLAVQYLKSSLSSPFSFFVAIFSISFGAPIIEEFIFRGCLQNYLKNHLGPILSIICTSLIFSFMHFSLTQKASNFPLIASLFTFSLYLGFIYEKRRSLPASIALHSIFNTISVVMIVLDN